MLKMCVYWVFQFARGNSILMTLIVCYCEVGTFS